VFDTRHLAAVGFVVIAEQVQDAMENQDLEFARQRAVIFLCVATRGGGRDRDVAEKVGFRG
jgi:hypothetical protein